MLVISKYCSSKLSKQKAAEVQIFSPEGEVIKVYAEGPEGQTPYETDKKNADDYIQFSVIYKDLSSVTPRLTLDSSVEDYVELMKNKDYKYFKHPACIKYDGYEHYECKEGVKNVEEQEKKAHRENVAILRQNSKRGRWFQNDL